MYNRLGLLVAVASIANGLRGVSPQDESKYTPDANNRWACLNNPEIVLDFSQVNDNYCDCPDGSDEPGTSACGGKSSFYCANEGFIPSYIPSSYVDDGVCDYELCCDGSDENGTVECPNRCAELTRKYQEERKRLVETVEAGLAKKKELEAVVASEKEKLTQEIESASKELLKKEELYVTLKANYDESHTDDEYQDQRQELLSKVSPLLDQIGVQLADQSQYITVLEERVSKLETILNRVSEEYNPNFNDLAVKEAIKNFQDYSVNKAEDARFSTADGDEVINKVVSEIDQFEFSSSPDVVPKKTKSGFWDTIQAAASDLIDQFLGIEHKESSAGTSNGNNGSKEMQSLQGEIESLNSKIDSLTNEFNSNQYGPNGILRSYKDNCITKKYGEYNYKYCFTGEIRQEGNGNNVLIGKYSSVEVDKTTDNLKLLFDKGAKCWNGPIRQGIIEVECGADDELISVTEPEVCQYFLRVKSPIACEPIPDEPSLLSHDEL